MRVAPPPSARSLRLVLAVILVVGATPSPSRAMSSGCPDRCVCDAQRGVQCAGRDLRALPADLPLSTRQLILSDNRLAELPPLALRLLQDLVYLDLSGNSLTELTESTFGTLRRLVYLDLSFNRLTRVADRTFGLSGLVMLRMTDNPGLQDLPPGAFSGTGDLQVLDLSRNNLTALNVSALAALPALRSVGLGGNPWTCACHTQDLCLWLALEGFKFQEEGQTVCASPAPLRGSRLSEVGLGLRAQCQPPLGSWDYLFFILIGFAIFAAGTVSAWGMGVLMVLHQRYLKRKDQQGDPEGGGRAGQEEQEEQEEQGAVVLQERGRTARTGRIARTTSQVRGHPDRKASHGV